MKKERFNHNKKISFLVFLIVIALIFATSCAQKVAFLTSAVVPAARGTAKVKRDHNNNYAITIELYNLAEVERLQPPKNTYVIWLLTNENKTKNIGQINSSSKMFSKKLKATFETVSAFKPKQIFLTAEDEGNVQFPNSVVVLSTENF